MTGVILHKRALGYLTVGLLADLARFDTQMLQAEAMPSAGSLMA
jgi:hypothetical protein